LVIRGKMNKNEAEKRGRENVDRLLVTMKSCCCWRTYQAIGETTIGEAAHVGRVHLTAFAGTFRILEIICQSETKFDPGFALLAEDVLERKGCKGKLLLNVKLKCPKESKSVAPAMFSRLVDLSAQ
jgi:hypothetical protein